MAYRDLVKRRAQHKRNRDKRNIAVRETLARIKATTPCTDCKLFYPAYVMDFDHLRDKIKPVSRCRTIASMKTEIAKCELVCSNCHRIRTFKRRGL